MGTMGRTMSSSAPVLTLSLLDIGRPDLEETLLDERLRELVVACHLLRILVRQVEAPMNGACIDGRDDCAADAKWQVLVTVRLERADLAEELACARGAYGRSA